jgi:hypothetical protein
MPLAKIHVVEGRYDEDRIAKVSSAIQAALMNTLRVPPEGFFQLIFKFPKKRFLHTPSFVGMHYTDDLMITLCEAPGENFSFGQGEAQRANAVPREQKSRAS